ncbi:MAG: tyrosine-type recombinase/integrase [Paludibacteraceae bacterium]
MEIKRNIYFVPDKEKNKPDAKLRVRIKWDNKVLNFNVGYRVDIDKWDTKTQRCKANTTHSKKKVPAKDINSEIQKIEDNIDSALKFFEVKETIPTVDQLRDRYNVLIGKSKTQSTEKTFFVLFDQFVTSESKDNNWRYPTLQKFATVRSHLLSFDDKLTFEKLNEVGLNKYVNFLRDVKDMRNSTIYKQLGFLKWFLKWSSSKGYNSNLAYTTFNPKMDIPKRKVIFLDWHELMTVYNFDFRNAKQMYFNSDGTELYTNLTPENADALEKARDVYCFCCFTSLRHSDVLNLKRSNVFSEYISITTIKTADELTIQLNDYSKAILKKYENEVYPDNKALPAIALQKANDHIKQIGELCGLTQPITTTYYKGAERIDEVLPKYQLLSTHSARRTFICNALAMGMPTRTVMSFTGHASYNSLKPYEDVAGIEKKEAMNLFNKKNEKADLLEKIKNLPIEKLKTLIDKL